MIISTSLKKVLVAALEYARKERHEYVVPEHFVISLCSEDPFRAILEGLHTDPDQVKNEEKDYLDRFMNKTEHNFKYVIDIASGFEAALQFAGLDAGMQNRLYVDCLDVFYAIYKLPGGRTYGLFSRLGADPDLVYKAMKQMRLIKPIDENDLNECEKEDLKILENILSDDNIRMFSRRAETIQWMKQLAEDNKRIKAEQKRADDITNAVFGDADIDDKTSRVAAGNGLVDDPQLSRFVILLNDRVKKKHELPLIGRDRELAETMLVLLRRDKNNPLHVGEPGVGKTAIVHGLAVMINEGKVPDKLKNARIYQIDMTNMVAGTTFRGDFEKRMSDVLSAIEMEEDPIVYIDEIHTVIGAGASGGGPMDGANILKPFLLNGRIRFIGSTTYDEYKKYFQKNKALDRRFQKIDIEEPSEEETVQILYGIRSVYEGFHNVLYQDDIIPYIVKMSRRYFIEKFDPDKSIDVLDTAGTMVGFREYENGALESSGRQPVTRDDVNEVLSKMLRVPLSDIKDNETEELISLERRIKKRVFGQDEAVKKICDSYFVSRAGLNEENKPVASFLFVGPTGVGKTEIARTLADELKVPLIRFDMSEYMERQSVAKFIGAPAGYVGYEEGGILTDAIRKNPRSVLLLDEIEKASHDIYNVLLQVMDYATLTDNQGRKADFRNVIIIMTSNAGVRDIEKASIGFGAAETNPMAVNEAVNDIFAPEFRNRLSAVVRFNGITREVAEKIVDKDIKRLEENVRDRKLSIEITDELKEKILDQGYSEKDGARRIQKEIDDLIKPVLVHEIIFGKLKSGGRAVLSLDGENVRVKVLS
ncbi:MAG: AAA family ATPase [Lachnospiraceae bacterium]|nr:AAA family ATPase [Lachnospiraceae bacterium]MEE3461024.1 AAA family ATPase [Lachnospiraceae bacterium]